MHPALGVALGTLGIVLGAQITVPMVPVPMTLQTLAVLVCGIALGPRRGSLAAALYVGLVLIGLPVLADGERAGGSAFLQLKSAGYVVGFVAAAWTAGRVGFRRPWMHRVGAGLAGHAVVLGCGVPVLMLWIGRPAAVEYGLVPFLPGAFVKSVLAATLASFTPRPPEAS